MYQPSSFLSTPLIDAQTGNPIDSTIFDIYLAPDGTRALFNTLTEGTYQGEEAYFLNLSMGTATIDANGVTLATLTPLTHNETSQDSYVRDEFGQLSPDGKTIVDAHYSMDPATNMYFWSIGVMNADGSNFHIISPLNFGWMLPLKS